MVLILLIAAALRLMAIGQVPPGLYHDEAYNGLDALNVLDGDLSLYFGANNGREPMFIYLIALSVGLLGRSPFAVRLTAFAPGLLTVAASYAMARVLFGRRVGLLSAAVLSVTLWHVHLSRVGFRAVLLPLFIALAVWQGALGWRTGRRRHWLVAGAVYGLSTYTYMAARFTPVALLLFGLYLVLTRAEWRARPRLASLAWPGAAMLVMVAPLVAFGILHPDLVFSRTGQVSIWNAEIHGGDFWGTLIRHSTRTLGMFFVKGDRIWRHNVPWRPVFDPLLGAFFLLGLVRALRRFRDDAAMAFIIIWTVTLMLPTLLAEDAPHFLRAVGVLPLVTLFPALGMDWLLRISHSVLRRRRYAVRYARYVIPFALVIILLIALISTTKAYFGGYARADTAAYWFEDGAVTLAGRINGFLGTGWDGERMLTESDSAGQHTTSSARRVYVEPALWKMWTSVPFLVTESPFVHLLPVDQTWPTVNSGPAAVFVWPYGDWRRAWNVLDAPAQVSVEEGALSQGDRDPEPYATFLAFYVTPVEGTPQVLARFQGGVELVGAQVQLGDQELCVELSWYATAPLADDYTVFVHYVRDEQRLAQDDAQPAGNRYPTHLWHAGDLVRDEHCMSLPGSPDPSRDQIFLGFYRPEDGQRLDLLDQAGNPASTFMTLPIKTIGAP
jgi:4-amino-4-deoxy-L-arabinose transferase-like glycosyltransferase